MILLQLTIAINSPLQGSVGMELIKPVVCFPPLALIDDAWRAPYPVTRRPVMLTALWSAGRSGCCRKTLIMASSLAGPLGEGGGGGGFLWWEEEEGRNSQDGSHVF